MFGHFKPEGKDFALVEKRFIINEFYGQNWDPHKIALEQDAVLDHLKYWAEQIVCGKVLLAGPWANFEMAWIVLSDKVTTWEEAEEIANGDPWAKTQQVEVLVQEWDTNPLLP